MCIIRVLYVKLVNMHKILLYKVFEANLILFTSMSLEQIVKVRLNYHFETVILEIVM